MTMPLVETKAERIKRKFGAAPVATVSNGVNGRLHRSHQNGERRTRRKTVARIIRDRLQTQFGAACTKCFNATLQEMVGLPVETIVQRSEDFARALFENAKERGVSSLLHWANYRKNGLNLYERIILDACEQFLPAPAVDATFVWLYLDSERQSDELRWSLRSVFANYNGKADVIVFGDKPSWYCGPHVPIRRVAYQHRRRFRDTLNKLHAACTSPLVPDTFVWMMDDTYFLRRVSLRDLSINRYQGSVPATSRSSSGFGGVKADAFTVLREAGLPCVDFCTHLPKVVEKAKFLEVWDRFELDKRVLAWELLYGACYYENYQPSDSFFGLILNSRDLQMVRSASIVNNGNKGWSEELRAELWNRFPIQSEVETADASPPNWEKARIPSRRYNYEIRAGYRCRAENNSGIAVPDAAQRNVYQYAASIPDVRTVIDWGTGSGSKLVEFFGDRQAIGVDVQDKVTAARSRFPSHEWRVAPIAIECDMLIVADVIEHLADPLELLSVINAGNWRHCVISTPERDLARGPNDLGPPKNPRHVREWNTGEFVRFIRKHATATIEAVRVLGEYNLVVHLKR